jgi:hypothetical protein
VRSIQQAGRELTEAAHLPFNPSAMVMRESEVRKDNPLNAFVALQVVLETESILLVDLLE